MQSHSECTGLFCLSLDSVLYNLLGYVCIASVVSGR